MTFGKMVAAVCVGVLLAAAVLVFALAVLDAMNRAAAREAAASAAEGSRGRSMDSLLGSKRQTAAQLACLDAAEKGLAHLGAIDVDLLSLRPVGRVSGSFIDGLATVTPAAGPPSKIGISCRMKFDGDRATVLSVAQVSP